MPQRILSVPLWVKQKDFAALKAERAKLSALHGEVYNFDHIVPINHPRVCGLTVPWNIQVVPARVNAAKSNTWNPEQLELL
jgi:hypothetical protein